MVVGGKHERRATLKVLFSLKQKFGKKQQHFEQFNDYLTNIFISHSFKFSFSHWVVKGFSCFSRLMFHFSGTFSLLSMYFFKGFLNSQPLTSAVTGILSQHWHSYMFWFSVELHSFWKQHAETIHQYIEKNLWCVFQKHLPYKEL